MLRVSQLIALTLASVAAAAAAPCPDKDRGTLDEWKCFGQVEYTSRTGGEGDFGARFVVFASGERLYEKREPTGVKAKLMGESYTLYHGLEREDSTSIGRHDPFIFFEFALMAPFIVLFASESPPSALPSGTTRVRYAGDGKAAGFMREIGIRSVRGSIERTGDDYRFAADSVGNVATGLLALWVNGRWSPELVEPYADSMPVEGWRYPCVPASADVRGNHRPVPAGVTLGDVRKGWRGSCD